MPSKKCGIPRDWSKSEGLSGSERISLKSGGTLGSGISSSARFINSVSDLCAADEIDALLDEIRDLEPISIRTHDVQDFEIDGSTTRLPYDMTCDSRTSVHSWDSHALYSHNRVSLGVSRALDLTCHESGPRQRLLNTKKSFFLTDGGRRRNGKYWWSCFPLL